MLELVRSRGVCTMCAPGDQENPGMAKQPQTAIYIAVKAARRRTGIDPRLLQPRRDRLLRFLLDANVSAGLSGLRDRQSE
jgi:hypothetical protein